VLGRFNEDLSQFQRAVRNCDGNTLFDLFTRTRAVRRAIVDIGQDTPSFGRLPFQVYVPPKKSGKKKSKKKNPVRKKSPPKTRVKAKRRRTK